MCLIGSGSNKQDSLYHWKNQKNLKWFFIPSKRNDSRWLDVQFFPIVFKKVMPNKQHKTQTQPKNHTKTNTRKQRRKTPLTPQDTFIYFFSPKTTYTFKPGWLFPLVELPSRMITTSVHETTNNPSFILIFVKKRRWTLFRSKGKSSCKTKSYSTWELICICKLSKYEDTLYVHSYLYIIYYDNMCRIICILWNYISTLQDKVWHYFIFRNFMRVDLYAMTM